MNNLDYRVFSKDNNLPLFSEPWFLDAVCGINKWEVVSVKIGEKTVLTGVHITTKKIFFDIMNPITFAQVSGPIIHPYNFNINRKCDSQEEYLIMQSYIDKIKEKKYSQINIKLDYNHTSWLPFYWNGFSQTTRYTYIIEKELSVDEIFNKLGKNLKYTIKKKYENVKIREDNDYAKIFTLITKSYNRRNSSFTYDYKKMNTLFLESQKIDRGKILLAYDKEENLCSGIFVIWDNFQLFLLGSGSDPRFLKNEFNTILIWEAIKLSREKGLVFNFEGSMMKGVNSYFKKFSPTLIPYHVLTKTNSRLLKLLYTIRGKR